MIVEHSETWEKPNYLHSVEFSFLYFLVWSLLNCSAELMSANLEVMILGKQARLQAFTLNYFARPPRKAGKTDTNFLTCEKVVSGFWLVIRHFSLVRKIVWPMRLLLIKERLFLFSEFALTKSQYFYNKSYYCNIYRGSHISPGWFSCGSSFLYPGQNGVWKSYYYVRRLSELQHQPTLFPAVLSLINTFSNYFVMLFYLQRI